MSLSHNILAFNRISFYHGPLSRHVAEALLMGNGEEGNYLLRDSTPVGRKYCVSVRGKDEVKHFELEIKRDVFYFGSSEFVSMDSLLKHFANKPVLRSRSANKGPHYVRGATMTLKYPYPAVVEEPEAYDEIRFRTTDTVTETYDDLHARVTATPIATKSGYLSKQGGFVKTWKCRWFVCIRNDLKYFEYRDSETPIHVINLKECSRCTECKISGKSHCLALDAKDRTWNFSAECEEDLEEWLALLTWKLRHNRRTDAQRRLTRGKNSLVRS